MADLIFSPFARRMASPSPKDYPQWRAVITQLEFLGHRVHQLGSDEDPRITSHWLGEADPAKLADVLQNFDLVLCVDTWLQHAAAALAPAIPRVVVWRCTSSAVFGPPGNINVAHPQQVLAEDQFAKAEAWGEAKRYPYPDPLAVVQAVLNALQDGCTRVQCCQATKEKPTCKQEVLPSSRVPRRRLPRATTEPA
jgi:hypothetical protein